MSIGSLHNRSVFELFLFLPERFFRVCATFELDSYFCEKPKNSQAIAQQVATSLIATIPSFNDALLKSSAMRELSYISYAMSLEERETVIKLLTFNSSFNQSENQTLFSNYATALLNLFEVHYFNKLEASNEDLFKNLESFY